MQKNFSSVVLLAVLAAGFAGGYVFNTKAPAPQELVSLAALIENPAVRTWYVQLQGNIQSVLSDGVVLADGGSPVTVYVIGDSPAIFGYRSSDDPRAKGTPLRFGDLKRGDRLHVQATVGDDGVRAVTISRIGD